jgi:hypothetical protein
MNRSMRLALASIGVLALGACVGQAASGQDQSGWEIGMAPASEMSLVFSTLAVTYPSSTAGLHRGLRRHR